MLPLTQLCFLYWCKTKGRPSATSAFSVWPWAKGLDVSGCVGFRGLLGSCLSSRWTTLMMVDVYTSSLHYQLNLDIQAMLGNRSERGNPLSSRWPQNPPNSPGQISGPWTYFAEWQQCSTINNHYFGPLLGGKYCTHKVQSMKCRGFLGAGKGSSAFWLRLCGMCECGGGWKGVGDPRKAWWLHRGVTGQIRQALVRLAEAPNGGG